MVLLIKALKLRGRVGESEPKSRTAYPTDDNMIDSKNVAFFSTFAVAGDGKGIVIGTGNNTIIGRLADLTSNMTKSETPLAKEIREFVNLLIVIALVFGTLFFFMSLFIDGDVIRAFTYFLGIIIANVPEVLLITVTTSLTLTAKKMAAKNCLVKNLEAVETLGSTSIICSDKTGTLTQNKMSVSNIWFDNARYHVPFYSSMGVERDILVDKPAFNIFIKSATLCLRAQFEDTPEPQSLYSMIEDRKVLGDASETGINTLQLSPPARPSVLSCLFTFFFFFFLPILNRSIEIFDGIIERSLIGIIKFCEHIHPTTSFRAEHPKVAEIPFNSTTKYQLSIHKDVNGLTIIMKGAPEIIIDVCTSILSTDGTTREMIKSDYDISKRACAEMGYMGQRVLAYCDYELPRTRY
jgi:sodium/potassium-transporting ATPase subunit alpha